MRSFLSSFSALCLLGLLGCARPNPHDSLVNMQAPASPTQVLAIYQPWWGDASHINVGYSSHDEPTLRQQIAHARELNISGFVVNWYGPRHEYNDKTFALLQQMAAETPDFKVAAQYDEAVDHPGSATDAVIVDLQYLYDRYISPSAGESRAAYLRYRGRPVVFIFPKGSGTDWDRVRQVTQSWADPPLLIYKDPNHKYNDAFDGYYAWVQPGKGGWARDGSHWGEDYLNYFYKTMKDHYPNKIVVGAVWPGFDDSKASWGRNRHMAYHCGRTFENTVHVFHKYYGPDDPAAFILVETWNDFEEGTDIERGISHCGSNRRDSVDTARAGQP